MNMCRDMREVPENQVLSVVEEALQAGAIKIQIKKQNNGEYTVSWKK